MNKNTIEWKITAMKTANRVLINYFKNSPQIDGVLYKDMWVPDFLFEMMLQAINRMETEAKVSKIAKKLNVRSCEIRKQMVNFSLSELETAYVKQWKIVVRKHLKYYKTTE